MGDIRKPLFVASLVLILLVVLMEVGSLGVLGGAAPPPGSLDSLLPPVDPNDPNSVALAGAMQDSKGDLASMLGQDKPPGRAIPAMALLDGVLLLITALWAVDVLLGSNVYAVASAPTTCVVSLLLTISSIITIIVALVFLLLMVGLLLAVPFGTLAYLALYGFFNRGGAAGALGLIMTLKIAYLICLVIAQPDILRRPSIILLAFTSLLANVIISFLHGLVPGFLVSITDDVAAIVMGILAVIWALFYLIGAILPTLRVVKSLFSFK
jgi:hypothetical protein